MPPNQNDANLNKILEAISSVKSEIAIDNKEGHGKIYDKINELRIDTDRRIDTIEKTLQRDINMIEKEIITINHEIKVHEQQIKDLNEKLKNFNIKHPDEWLTSKVGQMTMWGIMIVISTLISGLIKKII